MATPNEITVRAAKRRPGPSRTARDARPLPSASPKSETKIERAKESRQLILSDAEIAVQWLNASRGTRSHDKVASIRRELEDLQSEWGEHSFGLPPWLRPITPGINNTDAFREKHRRLEERHHSLNEVLGHYIFRPRITLSVYENTWHFGMVPDDNRKSFQIEIGARTIAEADAVISMVRLHSTGDLGQVHLCKMCRQTWHVAAKRSYQFCSGVCRMEFYASNPDYHEKKASIQRRYRKRLKQREAKGFLQSPLSKR
jgi:hypothetical protein